MGQLGETLRQAREDKGVSLTQAEAATMIRRAYLQALEDDEHAVLPGAVYIKGFLRNYATYLGLDAGNVLSLYHREYRDVSQDIVAPATIKPRGTSQLVTGGTLAGALLIVVLSIFSVYIYRQVQAFRLAQPAAAAEALVPTPTPIPATPIGAAAVAASSTPAPQPTPTPVPSGAEVTAKVSQDAWMQVMVDGQPSFEGTLKAGQSQTWKGKGDVFLWVGNAGGVSVVFNGQDIGTLGAKGEIVKKDFKI
ncbi:MAG: helix-turn-helix domain-containing protein [Chloroflexi bacterium]|nr:helix-turn-helix domain-containing protein [Chloroflexota bacterium]